MSCYPEGDHIPDGIYDLRSKQVRAYYRGGVPLYMHSRARVEDQVVTHTPGAPWGTYPDVPRAGRAVALTPP